MPSLTAQAQQKFLIDQTSSLIRAINIARERNLYKILLERHIETTFPSFGLAFISDSKEREIVLDSLVGLRRIASLTCGSLLSDERLLHGLI